MGTIFLVYLFSSENRKSRLLNKSIIARSKWEEFFAGPSVVTASLAKYKFKSMHTWRITFEFIMCPIFQLVLSLDLYSLVHESQIHY